MVRTADIAGRSLSGKLSAEAVFRSGQTRLTGLYHSVPFHVSKPYWDGSVLLLQIASPTAGLFSGDRLSSVIRVEKDASLLLTNQGASRIHPREGADAELEQDFEIASGGWLEIYPELIIPHRGAGLTFTTKVRVAEGGRAYLAEMLAPGRIATGEAYLYEKLDWRFRLDVDGRPLVVERAEISADTVPWMFARPTGWKHAYYGCVWMVGDELEKFADEDFEKLEQFSDTERRVGVTRLAREAIAVKVVAASSIPLRKALASIRDLMSGYFPNLKCNPRKL